MLIHLADAPEGGSVSERAMLSAIAWAGFLEQHARRLYAPALNPALHSALELDRHIRNGDLTSPFVARDVYRKHWSSLNRTETNDALDYMEDFDHLRKVVVETDGRSRTEYRIHPDLLQKEKA